MLLDPIKGNQQAAAGPKHMMPSASIDSFQRRPVSGISKEGSQSRFRQSQGQFKDNQAADGRSMSEAGGQFQLGFNQGQSVQNSARPDSNSIRQHLNSGRQPHIHEEYSEEAYLEY